jgi:tRNA-dihydrouridine synthase A
MLPYIDHWVRQGLKLNKITRHMLMLFAGQPGSRLWRQILTEESCKAGAGVDVVQQAMGAVQRQDAIQVQLGQVQLGQVQLGRNAQPLATWS